MLKLVPALIALLASKVEDTVATGKCIGLNKCSESSTVEVASNFIPKFMFEGFCLKANMPDLIRADSLEMCNRKWNGVTDFFAYS